MSKDNKNPLRLEVLTRLTRELMKISAEDGFNYDLDGHVFRGISVFGEGDPDPLVSILEEPQPPQDTSAPGNTTYVPYTLGLIVQGFVAYDRREANKTDPAHRLAADVCRRLAEIRRDGGSNRGNILNDPPWCLGGRNKSPITDLRMGRPVIRPDDDNISGAFAQFWLSVSIEMVENMLDPYDY